MHPATDLIADNLPNRVCQKHSQTRTGTLKGHDDLISLLDYSKFIIYIDKQLHNNS